MSKYSDSNILDSIEILLAHYRYISLLHDMQGMEFRIFIKHMREDIYPAFVNKDIPITDIYIKNIVNDYLKIMRSTMKKISNTIEKENKNGNQKAAKKLKRYLDILNLKYFKRECTLRSQMIRHLNISERLFCIEQKKAIEVFAEYLLPIAAKKGYKTIISYNTIAILSVLEKIYISVNKANEKGCIEYQFKHN